MRLIQINILSIFSPLLSSVKKALTAVVVIVISGKKG